MTYLYLAQVLTISWKIFSRTPYLTAEPTMHHLLYDVIAHVMPFENQSWKNLIGRAKSNFWMVHNIKNYLIVEKYIFQPTNKSHWERHFLLTLLDLSHHAFYTKSDYLPFSFSSRVKNVKPSINSQEKEVTCSLNLWKVLVWIGFFPHQFFLPFLTWLYWKLPQKIWIQYLIRWKTSYWFSLKKIFFSWKRARKVSLVEFKSWDWEQLSLSLFFIDWSSSSFMIFPLHSFDWLKKGLLLPSVLASDSKLNKTVSIIWTRQP